MASEGDGDVCAAVVTSSEGFLVVAVGFISVLYLRLNWDRRTYSLALRRKLKASLSFPSPSLTWARPW